MNKGLEALNKINSGAVAVHTPYEGWQDENIRIYYAEEFNIIENELKEKEELEKLLAHERELNNHLITYEGKALEIIKNKKVQVAILLLSNSCDGYNMTRGLLGEDLEQEEYDLLKEVLEND